MALGFGFVLEAGFFFSVPDDTQGEMVIKLHIGRFGLDIREKNSPKGSTAGKTAQESRSTFTLGGFQGSATKAMADLTPCCQCSC